jgi:uncharacterized membrane protein
MNTARRKQWYEKWEWRWKTVAIWVAVVAVGGGLITVLVLAFTVVKLPTATADNAVLKPVRRSTVPVREAKGKGYK